MSTSLEKQLLYSLCEFLIDLKLTPEGKGIRRPLTIGLREFQKVLHNSEPTQAKLHELKAELQGLVVDMDGKLLHIADHSIFDSFSDKFFSNEPVTLTYKRLDFINYIQDLRDGDSSRAQGKNYNTLIFNPDTHSFHFRGEALYVGKRGRGRGGLPVRVNICLLLWGHKVCDVDSVAAVDSPRYQALNIFIDYPEYVIGEEVQYDVLFGLIYRRRNVEGPLGDRFRPIRDAITQLNKRFKDKWQIRPFEQSNQVVRIVFS